MDPTKNKFYENKIVTFNMKRLSVTLRNTVFLALYHYYIYTKYHLNFNIPDKPD